MPDWLIHGLLGIVFYELAVRPFLPNHRRPTRRLWVCPTCGMQVELASSDPAVVTRALQQMDATHPAVCPSPR